MQSGGVAEPGGESIFGATVTIVSLFVVHLHRPSSKAEASEGTAGAEGKAGGGLSSPHALERAATPAALQRREARRKVLLSGLITALGIALHNFPEGVAVFLASLKVRAVILAYSCILAYGGATEAL